MAERGRARAEGELLDTDLHEDFSYRILEARRTIKVAAQGGTSALSS